MLKSAGGFLIFYITKHQLKQLKTNVINDSVIVILYSCRSTETVKEKQENGADCCCRECVQKFQEKKAGKFDSVLRNEGEALKVHANAAERNKKSYDNGEDIHTEEARSGDTSRSHFDQAAEYDDKKLREAKAGDHLNKHKKNRDEASDHKTTLNTF